MIRVRSAQATDAQAMAEILNPLIEEGTSTALEGVQAADRWIEVASGSGHRMACFVAEDADGEVLGFQFIEPSRQDPDGVCGINSFVRNGGGGRGVGRALFAETVKAATALGYREIGATIRGDNVSGLGYYAKMGFRDDRVFPDVPMGDGRKIDRIRKVFDLGVGV